jgi:hypothetical protein
MQISKLAADKDLEKQTQLEDQKKLYEAKISEEKEKVKEA